MNLKKVQYNVVHITECWSPGGLCDPPWRMAAVTKNVPFSRFTIASAHTPSTQCGRWKTAGSLKAQPEIFSKPHVSFIHFNRKCRGTREIPFIFSSSCTKRVWLNTARSTMRALERKFPLQGKPCNLIMLRQYLEKRLNWDIPYRG